SSAPSFEGHLRAHGISLKEEMSALGYLVPVLAGTSGCPDGRLDLNLYLRGRGADRAALRSSVVGHGSVNLDPIALEDSRLLDALAQCVTLPAQGRIGSIRGDFAIQAGRIASDNLTIDVSTLPIVLSGWTDFDGRVNYRVRGDRLIEKLPGK